MNLPFAGSKQQSHKQGGRISREQECDDAASSSATYGSAYTAAASSRRMIGSHFGTPPTSTGNITAYGGYEGSTSQPFADSPNGTRTFKGQSLRASSGLHDDRTYSIDRFVRDIDPREKVRLGKFKHATQMSQEKDNEGVEKRTGTHKSNQDERLKRNKGQDQMQSVEARKMGQERNGAA